MRPNGGCKLLALLPLCFLLALNTHGQTATGTLTGLVKDETGAVIPGVQITIRNESTNAIRAVVTSDSGLYQVSALSPGRYEVKAERSGFETLINSGVVLSVGEVLTLGLRLDVGEISQTTTVEGAAQRVHTEDSQISSLVDERRVVDLPLNGRDVYVLATLQPGVVPSMATVAQTSGPNSSFFSAAGARHRGNNFTLDGQTNTNDSISGEAVIIPAVDSVQEFRLIRNNFSAEFGTHSGSVINVITKSGTNEFHGNLWEFHRNAAVDAAEVFAPFDPQSGEKDKAPLVQNQFGFTLGGQIVEDHSFFFLSYEGFRQRSGEPERVFVETPEFRRWVIENNPSSLAAHLFNNFPAPAPTQNVQTVLDLNPDYPQLAPGVSLINPVLPPPDLPVLGSVDRFVSASNDQDQFSARIDNIFNDGDDHLFGRYIFQDQRLPDTTIRGAFGDNSEARSQTANISFVHIFSPRVINEARLGYLYHRTGFFPGSDADIPHMDILGPAGVEGASGLNVGSGAAFGSFLFVPQFFRNHTFQWQDILSINVGNHGIRTGVDLRKLQENGDFGRGSRPLFQYQGLFDFANDAPFLLIAGVDPTTGALTSTPRGWRSTELGIFIQDDWKVHPRLTLNLGIRWDYFQPATEIQNRLSNIIFAEIGSYFGRIATARVGVVDQLYDRDLNNFAPRFGFAWDLFGDGKTALRGGYGVSYEKLFFNVGANARFNPPFYGLAVLSPFFGNEVNPFLGTDASDVFGGFPDIVVPGADLGLDERGGIQDSRVSLRVLDPSLRDSYIHSFFLGLQREFPWQIVGELNYQGTLGRKLPFIGDPNRFSGDLLGNPDPFGRFAGDLDENRLNPSFESFNLRQNRITSSYHGLNSQLNKRFSHGLSFQIAYTFGKTLDFDSDVFGSDGDLNFGGSDIYFADPLNLKLDYGRAAFDIRHRFVASFLWEIPFMQRQPGRWGQILGGWQLNAIVPIQSGLPFGPVNRGPFPAGDYNADGQEQDRPDTPTFGNRFEDSPSTRQFIDGVFERVDFPAPEAGSPGNLGKNTFNGPSYWTVDLSFFKNFRLPINEESKLQFRAEFFNLFNRVNLWLPRPGLNSAAFGQSTRAFDAREIQFAVKILF